MKKIQTKSYQTNLLLKEIYFVVNDIEFPPLSRDLKYYLVYSYSCQNNESASVHVWIVVHLNSMDPNVLAKSQF